VNGPSPHTFGRGGLDPLLGQMSTEVFRALLRSISRPGTIETVSPTDRARLRYGEALSTLAIPALALANVDVKLGVLGGVPRDLIASADLVLGDRFMNPMELRLLKIGTATDPHLSARLCVQVDEICDVRPQDVGKSDGVEFEEFEMVPSKIVDPNGLDPVTIEMRGPGVRSFLLRRVHGLPTSVLEAIVELNRSFPVGVDTHLISRHGDLMSIPRTTRLRVVPVEPLRLSKQAKFLANDEDRSREWAM
jgi:phosphonate C-P lyase system protein PhnH